MNILKKYLNSIIILILLFLNFGCRTKIQNSLYVGSYTYLFFSDAGTYKFVRLLTGDCLYSKGSWIKLSKNKIIVNSIASKDSLTIEISESKNNNKSDSKASQIEYTIHIDSMANYNFNLNLIICDSIKFDLGNQLHNIIELDSSLYHCSFYFEIVMETPQNIVTHKNQYFTFKKVFTTGNNRIDIFFLATDVDFLNLHDTLELRGNQLLSDYFEILKRKNRVGTMPVFMEKK